MLSRAPGPAKLQVIRDYQLLTLTAQLGTFPFTDRSHDVRAAWVETIDRMTTRPLPGR